MSRRTASIPAATSFYVTPCPIPISAANVSQPQWGRKAAVGLVQGGLGYIGLGITWVAIWIGAFFFACLAMYLGIIAVLYGLCQLVGV